MWTAAWIFFYGAYHVILNRNPRYLIISLASSLVHYSFLAANAVLIIYFIAGNRNIIYLPLAVLSFILPKLVTPLFQSVFGTLGGALKARADMYASEAVILGRQESVEQLSWFMKIGEDLVLYYLLFGIIVIQVNQKNSMRDQSEKTYLVFCCFSLRLSISGKRFHLLVDDFRSFFSCLPHSLFSYIFSNCQVEIKFTYSCWTIPNDIIYSNCIQTRI